VRCRIAALLLSLTAVPSAGAQGIEQQPRLSLGEGITQAGLTFKPERDTPNAPKRARLTLLVRNMSEESGSLEIMFLRPRWLPRRPLSPLLKPGPAKQLEVVWTNNSTSASIGAQHAVPIVLLFRIPAKGVPAAATGHLLIRLMNEPSVAAIDLPVAPAAGAATPARFDQPKSTMRVTRWCGLFTRPIRWLSDHECLQNERIPISASGTLQRKETLLSGDRGQTLRLHLEGGGDPGLRASKIGGPGTYEGQLVLDPTAEKPQTVQATVKARDAIIWPLLFVAGGIGVAFLIRFWQAVWRGRGILRTRLQEVVDPYLKRRLLPDGGPRPLTSDEAERPEMYEELDAMLNELGEKQFSEGADCSSADLRRVPSLYCEIGKADSNERLAELEKQIAEIESLFRRRMQIFAGFDQLSEAASGLDGQLPIKRDAEDVLDLATVEVLTDEESALIARRLRVQALITVLYRVVGRRYAGLSERLKELLKHLHPAVIYGDPGKALARTPEDQAALRLRFTAALRMLHDPEAAVPRRVRLRRVAPERGLWLATAERVPLREFPIEPPPDEPQLTPAQVADDIVAAEVPTPTETRSRLERIDWVVFGVSAALAALAYLLPQYRDATYGTMEDYLLAFTAGAAGTVAINWLLAPFSRLYTRLDAPQEVKAG
jgi:hypothetical protein